MVPFVHWSDVHIDIDLGLHLREEVTHQQEERLGSKMLFIDVGRGANQSRVRWLMLQLGLQL